MIEIVLVAPEIPQNTGAVARLCGATGIGLHLVGPLGFAIDDRHLKRAGLDYWSEICLGVHRDLPAFLAAMPGRPLRLFSKRGAARYDQASYLGNELLLFGCESEGLPLPFLADHADCCFRLPMANERIRSLNLAGAVHAVAYHALWRLGFPGCL